LISVVTLRRIVLKGARRRLVIEDGSNKTDCS
jgi:hypothetical protein